MLAGGVAAAASLLLAQPAGARRILVLGGTRFVGRHVVAAALARGHHVTLFNRGRSAPGLFPAAEELLGDRLGDLAALRGRRWDAVIDTWAQAPEAVQRSCAQLRAATGHYVYISSTMVYDDRSASAWTEATRLHTVPAAGPSSYTDNKRACEELVLASFAGQATIVRPAVIVGPHDGRLRFVRWPLRVREGGEMLVPGTHDATVPFTDVRDLAQWLTDVIEARLCGIFNVAGALRTMGALIDRCVAMSMSPATPVWVDDAWLRARNVNFDSMPSVHASGYRRCSSARAIASGLRFRDLDDTLRDTLAWWDAFGDPGRLRDTLDRAREQALLAAWQARPVSARDGGL